jgi:hypothetical protein
MRRTATLRQAPIDWSSSRNAWTRQFPKESTIRRLPDELDREAVRDACRDAARSERAAKDAFFAAMAWGYGDVGYGPWRVAQALSDPEAGRKLLHAVRSSHAEGPLEAYRRMATDCRLQRIGPAFGTKFLFFIDSQAGARRALILDRLVADWLRRNVGYGVNPVLWSPRSYETYLDHMHEWAKALEIAPDELECAMFSEMADEGGGQWATRPATSRQAMQ